MTTPIPNQDEATARKIISEGLGNAELQFATSICAPIYWIICHSDGRRSARNGTAFFLNTGSSIFAVTAAHVLAGFEEDRRSRNVETAQLGAGLVLDFQSQHAIIDSDPELDIATFRITADEVLALNKTVLRGAQNAWPPSPPQEGRGIYYSGFSGCQTLWLSTTELSFAATPGGGVADMIGRNDIWTVFDRQNWIDVMGTGLPPERFDFGGVSGGPMLSVIERNGLRLWTLAGVIYEGPNPSPEEGKSISGFETIKARRADLIMADGRLDRARL